VYIVPARNECFDAAAALWVLTVGAPVAPPAERLISNAALARSTAKSSPTAYSALSHRL
jgi:hypothetical protein